MNKVPALAILLVAVGLGSLAVGLAYTAYNASTYAYPNGQGLGPQGMMGQWYQRSQTQSIQSAPITIDQAKTIAQQYLTSTGNSNLAIKEIMEFQYNFYIQYYEKDTGRGAFEMLIWKQTPPSGLVGGGMMGGGMMGGYYYATGTIVPEPGPNMMWNAKYSMMGRGIMGWQGQQSSPMTVTKDQALQIAQSYLDSNFNGAKVETDPTQFYGYFTMDFTINGKIAGMLSVNGYTGQVWFHTWHGEFIQEVDFT